MQAKKKITVTIDEEIYNAVEQAASKYKMPRSHLAQEALSLWLKKETEGFMTQGYQEMAEEDRQFSEMALESQKEVQR
jgi:metal-responsive CopG/Arc/MetJ family transcriptional regulator